MCCFITEVFSRLLNCYIQLGAIAVNLVAGDKPADVYSEIAARYGVVSECIVKFFWKPWFVY